MNAIENILTFQLVQKLGWALLHFIWQAAAVALLLAVLLRILRRFSANLRYVTACLALGLIVLLPVVTMQFINVPPPHQEQSEISISNTEIVPQVVELQSSVTSPPSSVIYEPVRHKPARKNYFAALKQKTAGILEPVLPHIVTGWLLGVFALSIWHLGGWTQLQKLRKKMVKQVDTSHKSKLNRLSEKLGVKQAVELLQSALVQIPTVVGWIKPVILLPASAMTGLNTEQLEAILAHELAHMKRLDYLVNILQTVVEILGFYHPAVWWVSHRIRAERENCCDDLAIAVTGDRVRYARALTSMEEIRGRSSELAVAVTGGNLFSRIRRLIGKDSSEITFSWIPAAAAILLLAALLIPAAIAITSASETELPENEPSNAEKTHSNTKVLIETQIIHVSDEFLAQVGLDADSMKNSSSWTQFRVDDSGNPTMFVIDSNTKEILLKNVDESENSSSISRIYLMAMSGREAMIKNYSGYDFKSQELGRFIKIKPELSQDGPSTSVDCELFIRRFKNFEMFYDVYINKKVDQNAVPGSEIVENKVNAKNAQLSNNQTLLILGGKLVSLRDVEKRQPILRYIPFTGELSNTTSKIEGQANEIILIKTSIDKVDQSDDIDSKASSYNVAKIIRSKATEHMQIYLDLDLEEGQYVEIKDIGKRKYILKQVTTYSIGKSSKDFPAYASYIDIDIRSNFDLNLSTQRFTRGTLFEHDKWDAYFVSPDTITGNGYFSPTILCVCTWKPDLSKLSQMWTADKDTIASLVAVTIKPDKPQEKSDVQVERESWGEELNGLQMRVTAPAGTKYTHLQTLPLVIEIQNISNTRFPIHRLPIGVRVEATDEAGRKLNFIEPRTICPWEGRRSDYLPAGSIVRWTHWFERFQFVNPPEDGSQIKMCFILPTRDQNTVPKDGTAELYFIKSNTIQLTLKDIPPVPLNEGDVPEQWAEYLDLTYCEINRGRSGIYKGIHIDGSGQTTIVGMNSGLPSNRMELILDKKYLNSLIKSLRNYKVWELSKVETKIAYPDRTGFFLSLNSAGKSMSCNIPESMKQTLPVLEPLEEEIQTLIKTAATLWIENQQEKASAAEQVDPKQKQLNDILEKYSKGTTADEDDKNIQNACKSVENYIAAALAGEDEKAAEYADPGSAVVRQTDDTRQVFHGQPAQILSVCSSEWNTLAISSVIQADRGRTGTAVFHLKKEILDQKVHWLIDDIDLETLDSIEREIKRFLERNPQAKTILFKPPRSLIAPTGSTDDKPNAQDIGEEKSTNADSVTIRLVDPNSQPVVGAWVGTYVDWSDIAESPPVWFLNDGGSYKESPIDSAAKVISNDQGKITLTQEELFKSQWPPERTVPLTALDEGHYLAGLRELSRKDLGKEVTLMLQPGCHVRGRVTAATARKRKWSTNVLTVYVHWQAYRPCQYSSKQGRFEFILPPGKYDVMVYSDDPDRAITLPIMIRPGQRDLDLTKYLDGTSKLPAIETESLLQNDNSGENPKKKVSADMQVGTEQEKPTDKPLEKSDLQVDSEEVWGELVDGVQVRLRGEKTVWQTDGVGQFKIDINSDTERVLPHYGPPLDKFEVMLDEQWYERNSDFFAGLRSVGPSPAKQRDGLYFGLDSKHWKRKSDGISMYPILIGKHVIRVAFPFTSTDGEKALAVSNPLEIEILPGEDFAKQLVDGALRAEPVKNEKSTGNLKQSNN